MSVPASLSWRLLWQMSLSRLAIAQQRSPHPQDGNHSEQGLGLLECLVAIAIIALTVAMISPPLFLATATRVQNRRAEQALQIAQGEVDRVQTLMSQQQNTPARLPQTVGPAITAAGPPSSASGVLKSVNARCNTYNDEQIPSTTALRVDVDGDCTTDFLLQSFRTDGLVPASETQPGRAGRVTAFKIGVRVYAFLAEGNWANLQREQASLQLTTGQGSQRTNPLAVLYSDISWSDQTSNLCALQRSQGRDCNI